MLSLVSWVDWRTVVRLEIFLQAGRGWGQTLSQMQAPVEQTEEENA